MSRAEWELVEMARVRAMAARLETLALDRAEAEGVDPRRTDSWALGWLATHCADKIVRLENARHVPTGAPGAAAPNPPDHKERGGVIHLHAVEPRASRK